MPALFSINRIFPGALLAAALGVGACSSDTAAPPPCPEILIPVDGAKLTRFKPGGGRNVVDVVHEEKIVGFAHMCEYNTDETGAGEITVLVAPDIESSRGPANESGQADFEYFLAIADQDKRILAKQRFPVTIPFSQSIPKVRWQNQDPNILHIPLKAGQNGTEFTVFVGLQLNREELEYDRGVR